MKNVSEMFRMNWRLNVYAQKLGLGYRCDVRVLGFDPACTQVEKNGTFKYPDMFHVNIESWDTFKLSFRPKDGRWVREGCNLSGKGLKTYQVYRMVRNNLRAHARERTRKESQLALVVGE